MFLFLTVQVVLDSIGISIWQMAVSPTYLLSIDNRIEKEESESEDDSDSEEEFHHDHSDRLLAAACDDGSVRLYRISDFNKLTYYRSLPRVSGMNFSTLIIIIISILSFYFILLCFVENYLLRTCFKCYMES